MLTKITVKEFKNLSDAIKEKINNSDLSLEELIEIIETTHDIMIFSNVDEWYTYQVYKNQPWKYELNLETGALFNHIDVSEKLFLLNETINDSDNTFIAGSLIIELSKSMLA